MTAITPGRPKLGLLGTSLECIRLLRIKQWVKNGFIFAPVLFAGVATDVHIMAQAALAFLSFCLISSSVYVLNDWRDRLEDRNHPEKCRRPLACGTVSGTAAAFIAVILFVGAMLIPLLMANFALLALEVAYAGINVMYSLYLKRVVILDIFTIASGFVIRVFAGAYAVNVACSHWIILCVFLLALFLGFTKRQNELAVLDRNSAAHRPVLVSYSAAFISQMNMIICAASIVCYAIYTVSPETVAKFGSDRLIYSVPFVIYGLFRYLYLSEVKNEGGSPADLLLRDRPLLICVALWIVCCAMIVYNGGPVKS